MYRIFGDTKPSLASNDYSTIVIFIVGGITTHEIQLVHEYSQQLKKQVKPNKIENETCDFSHKTKNAYYYSKLGKYQIKKNQFY